MTLEPAHPRTSDSHCLSGSLSLEDRRGVREPVNALERNDTLLVAKRDRLGGCVVAVATTERRVANERSKAPGSLLWKISKCKGKIAFSFSEREE